MPSQRSCFLVTAGSLKLNENLTFHVLQIQVIEKRSSRGHTYNNALFQAGFIAVCKSSDLYLQTYAAHVAEEELMGHYR